MSSFASQLSPTSAMSSIYVGSPMDIAEPIPERRNSKVQFNDDVQVAFTFPGDEYDRYPVEPRVLTSRDYLEYQIMTFEMNQSNKFEVTMRQLGLWSFFCASPLECVSMMENETLLSAETQTPCTPMSPLGLSASMHEFVGWTPRSQADPITKELLMYLHSRTHVSVDQEMQK